MRWKTFGLLVALSFIANSEIYADETPEPLLRCGQTDFGLCGFIDAEIWENEDREVFVIEPKFEAAKAFSEGLAAVQIEGKYGYIGRSGQIVIEPLFAQAGMFDHGLAVAGLEDAFGIIDRSGDYVVDPSFANAFIFSDQVILGVPAENSERAWLPSRDFDIYGAGIYNISQGWLTEQIYHFEHFADASRGLVWAQVPGGAPGTWDDLYGLMQVDGSWLIEPKYSFGIELRGNRAPVSITRNGETVYGAIDGDGREVIPFVFDYLTHWDDGFLLAGEGAYPNRKVGLINEDGELLAGRYFEEIQRPNRIFGPDVPERDYFTVKDGGAWKSLFRDGSLLPDQRVGSVFLECDKFQILHGASGYDLKPRDFSYPTIQFDRPLFSYSNRLCNPPPTLIRGDTYADILENGTVFGGFFENSEGFFGTHRWVRVDDKWGLVGAGGNFAVAPIYDSIDNEKGYGTPQDLPSAVADTTYRVTVNDEVYRLRFSEGVYTQEPFAELPEDRSRTLNCRGALKRKSDDGLWGIVDENGDDLIPPEYRAISCFNNGVAWVPDDRKRKWCPIDPDGQFQTALPCLETYYSRWVSHHDPEELDEDPYESSVIWMRALLDYGEGRRDQEPQFVPWQ